FAGPVRPPTKNKSERARWLCATPSAALPSLLSRRLRHAGAPLRRRAARHPRAVTPLARVIRRHAAPPRSHSSARRCPTKRRTQGAERPRRAMEAAMEVAADAAVAALAAVLLTALLPAALALALLMTVGRGAWLRWLERRHPELELERRTRVAAAMDSQRCQGLATALLALRGRLPRQRLLRALQ
ncbi:Uncharacterized protein GBIM_03777, partial [Gryllus bimaculatus]